MRISVLVGRLTEDCNSPSLGLPSPLWAITRLIYGIPPSLSMAMVMGIVSWTLPGEGPRFSVPATSSTTLGRGEGVSVGLDIGCRSPSSINGRERVAKEGDERGRRKEGGEGGGQSASSQTLKGIGWALIWLVRVIGKRDRCGETMKNINGVLIFARG